MTHSPTLIRTGMTPANTRPVILSEFGPPALACIRSWGRNGLSTGMICIRSGNCTIPDSRYLESYCSLSPTVLFRPEGIRLIHDFLTRFNATALIAINERISCWLNDNRNLLPASVKVCTSPNSTTQAVLSKIAQLNAAKLVKFDVLPTYFIDKTKYIARDILPEHFPLCLRPDAPNTTVPGFKVRIMHSTDELLHFVEDLKSIDSPILAQPFAELPNLVVHGARTQSGETMGISAFLVDRKFQGVTLTLRPHPIEKELQIKCTAFADYFDIVGNFHFEFLLDQKTGKVFFLELNSRLGGTTAKVFACGYDEPLLALAAHGVGQFISSPLSRRIVAGKHALIKFCLYAITKRLSALDYPNQSTFMRLINSVYGLIVFKDEILTLSDVRGSVAFYRSLISRG